MKCPFCNKQIKPIYRKVIIPYKKKKKKKRIFISDGIQEHKQHCQAYKKFINTLK